MRNRSSNKLTTPSILTRICARAVDYCLLFASGVLLSLALPLEISNLFYLVYALTVPGLFIPLEALLLKTWGTTAGKAILGITVLHKDGNKLSFKEALKRASFIDKRPGTLLQDDPGLLRRFMAYGIAVALIVVSALSKNITDSSIGGEKAQRVSGWVQYSAKEAGFKVDFPKDPVVESKEVSSAEGAVNYNEYTSEGKSKVTYSVSYIDIPKKWGFVSSKRILKGVLDVLMKLDPETELLNKAFAAHGEHSALNFHSKKGEEEVVGRLIRVGQRLFKLTITYPTATPEHLVTHTFLDSFTLEQPATK